VYQYWYTKLVESQKSIIVVFYRTAAGNEPVRKWLKALPLADKKVIGEDIKAIELSWPIGLPLVRKLDSDLWEVRSQLSGRIARVFFTVLGSHMVLLHGIMKKSQKTPQEDLSLAKRRRDDVRRGGIER
jgi:phage-related protein